MTANSCSRDVCLCSRSVTQTTDTVFGTSVNGRRVLVYLALHKEPTAITSYREPCHATPPPQSSGKRGQETARSTGRRWRAGSVPQPNRGGTGARGLSQRRRRRMQRGPAFQPRPPKRRHSVQEERCMGLENDTRAALLPACGARRHALESAEESRAPRQSFR